MEKKKLFSILCLSIAIFMLSACRAMQTLSEEDTEGMIVTSNIAMSNAADTAPVNDSVHTIALAFGEALDPKTISGAVKLYKMDAGGNPAELPCVAKIDKNNAARLLINNETVEKFAEGEEYKIVVRNAIQSTTGKTLESDFTGYFATNYTLDLAGSNALKNARSQIVVISDIHLGVDDAFAEIQKNKDALVNFLTRIKNSPNVAELVIAGDLLDGWFVPMGYSLPDSQSTFFDSVAANNKAVVDAFNAIIRAGQIKVTYVPGNHDLLLTQADVERIFPGINQARDDMQGLGAYVTGVHSEIVIEHGHRYNFFCAPDPISNRELTNNNSSILPPGYIFTRIATSSVIEGHPASGNTFTELTAPDKNNASQYGLYLYDLTWKGALATLPVNESFSDKVIKMNIDGYTQDYAIDDFIPYQNKTDGLIDVNLYQGIQDSWDERQTMNGVNVKIPTNEAIARAASFSFTDEQAQKQYFDVDASKRIVIFGHTHCACILPGTNLDGQKAIYANDGTWIENGQGYPTMTFVVITPPKPGSAVEIVNLYQYSKDNTITQWEQAQAITN